MFWSLKSSTNALPATTNTPQIPQGIRIALIAAGPTAAHAIIADVAGVCYTWGRNEKGQLGHGDLLQRNVPTKVAGLAGKVVTKASGGKSHTVVVTADGQSFGFGLNTAGALGTGAIRRNKGSVDDLQLAPVKCAVEAATDVACGADYTLWLVGDGGRVWSAGNPQYGQLGDGDDHMYNAKDSSIQIKFEPQPQPRVVTALKDHKIVKIASGGTHALAVSDAGLAFTWGNGNYGKLGHKVQADEHTPRQLEGFSKRILALPDMPVAAGSVSTWCCGTGPQLYGWGKLKSSGDNTTYPQPLHDLSGWAPHSMACGPATFAVAAERSVITWGQATNQELGYGEGGKKSSANPAKCEPLDEVYTRAVACGVGFTLFLCDPASDKVQKAPLWEPECETEEAVGGDDGDGAKAAGGGKRKAPAAAKGGGKKAK
jgi:alpha-tubulin suppressor-like RCC1 family protein